MVTVKFYDQATGQTYEEKDLTPEQKKKCKERMITSIVRMLRTG